MRQCSWRRGTFLEIRYNRPFRIIAAFICTAAEMMTNAIGPAVDGHVSLADKAKFEAKNTEKD